MHDALKSESGLAEVFVKSSFSQNAKHVTSTKRWQKVLPALSLCYVTKKKGQQKTRSIFMNIL